MKIRQRRSPARKRSRFGERAQTNKIEKDSQCQPKLCPQAVELRPPSIDMNRADQDVGNSVVPDLICVESDDSGKSLLDDKNSGSSCIHDANTSAASLSASEDVISDMTIVSYSGLEDEFLHPELIFDVADRCMILPFLEDVAVTNGVDDAESNECGILDSDGACLFLAIHQVRPVHQQIGYSCCYETIEDIDCFDPQLFISNCLDISESVPSYLPLMLPNQSSKRKLATLVLDLDDFTFPVYLDMKEQTVYVRQRPHLHTFLERVADMFEIIIFTASQSIYAEQLLNILDPDQKIISQRVYRESCIFSEGSYMKDLTILGRDLAKVVIIDNTPQVFQLQVNNGIPIESWFDDPRDSALLAILPFLETLSSADDVRPIIAKRFGTKY